MKLRNLIPQLEVKKVGPQDLENDEMCRNLHSYQSLLEAASVAAFYYVILIRGISGMTCTYPECFGGEVLVYLCDAPDLKFINDCVLMIDSHPVPAKKSGIKHI